MYIYMTKYLLKSIALSNDNKQMDPEDAQFACIHAFTKSLS